MYEMTSKSYKVQGIFIMFSKEAYSYSEIQKICKKTEQLKVKIIISLEINEKNTIKCC